MKFFLKSALFFLFTLGLSAPQQLFAQETEIPAIMQGFDGSFAIGMGNENPIFVGTLAFNRSHGVLKSKKLRLGYGLRIAAWGSKDLNYVTAPYRLTKEDLYDTLLVSNPLSISTNISLHIEYLFVPKFKAGFNIDALGFSLGSKSGTSFVSSDNQAGQFPSSPEARPTVLNALLIGDNDFGQLVSEFYVAYAINDRLWIRGGLNMTFAEYQTTVDLTNENDRFRNKAMLGFLAVSYNPF